MKSVEIDFIVEDSIKAIELYEKVFDLRRGNVTSYEKGVNEAEFFIYDTKFHMLDENEEYGLTALKEGQTCPMWINITLENIDEVYKKAIEFGFTSIQEVKDVPMFSEFGISNAIVKDPFGYVWMMHQVEKEIKPHEIKEILDQIHGN